MPSAALAAGQSLARVLWFGNSPANISEEERKRIREGFASHGLVEGRDIKLTFHVTDEEALPKVVATRPDVIVMLGHPGLAELGGMTRDIPVVFYNLSLDPIRMGLIETLRRPGRNFTGAVIQWSEITTRCWQLLKEVRPSMKRGGVLIAKEDLDSAAPDHGDNWKEAQRLAARELGIEIRYLAVPRDASASVIAAAVRDAGVEALEVGYPATAEFVAFLNRHPIPTIGFSFGRVRKGSLMLGISFEWNEGESQAIAMAARILRGERPATIPVYQTRSYGLAVNLRLARAVGIEIPKSILVQADEIVQ